MGKNLSFTIGYDKNGAEIPYVLDSKDSIILMAGTCGNGRTTLIEYILAQLADNYSPDEVQFILADTIGISFKQYEDSSHLIEGPLTKPKDIVKMMDWILAENERRAEIVKNSKDKNKAMVSFPAIVFVIDEFSYLFKKDGVEHGDFTLFLSKFNKLSRYTNTHIILSTQRREEEFLPALDLGYMPTRFIFHCLSAEESKRLILAAGAEDLKQGEFLFRNDAMLEPVFCKIKMED